MLTSKNCSLPYTILPHSPMGGRRRARTCVRSAIWLAGSMEHLRCYSGPDRSQDGTGADEIPVHHLPDVFSALRCSCPKIKQALQAGCSQKQAADPPLGCTKGGFAGLVCHQLAILAQAAIPHQPTDRDIYWSIDTPGSHIWQLPPQ